VSQERDRAGLGLGGDQRLGLPLTRSTMSIEKSAHDGTG
jgi:hypothetical protein